MLTQGRLGSEGLGSSDDVAGYEVSRGTDSVPGGSGGGGPQGSSSDEFRLQRCLTKPRLVKAVASFARGS